MMRCEKPFLCAIRWKSFKRSKQFQCTACEIDFDFDKMTNDSEKQKVTNV